VIAGRGRDHSAFFLIGGKLRECVARAAFLKTSGALQVVGLQKISMPGDLAQRNGRQTGRIKNGAFDAVARRFDLLECGHAL